MAELENEELVENISVLDEDHSAKMVSSEDKINAVLGITGGKSVDEFLDDLSLDTESIHSTLGAIDD